MTNRRDVLKGGMAAMAVPLGPNALLADGHPAEQAPPVVLQGVVYDTRLSDSIAFGRRLQSGGIPAHGFTGDVTRLWYGRLDPMWRAGPAAIAGLTGPDALFILERLAWEKGMKVVLRAEHRLAGGQVQHRIAAPNALRADMRRFETSDWAGAMAELARACPAAPAPMAATETASLAAPDTTFDDDGLVSWVIAATGKTAFPRT